MYIAIAILTGLAVGSVATHVYYNKAIAKLRQVEAQARVDLAAKIHG